MKNVFLLMFGLCITFVSAGSGITDRQPPPIDGISIEQPAITQEIFTQEFAREFYVQDEPTTEDLYVMTCTAMCGESFITESNPLPIDYFIAGSGNIYKCIEKPHTKILGNRSRDGLICVKILAGKKSNRPIPHSCDFVRHQKE